MAKQQQGNIGKQSRNTAVVVPKRMCIGNARMNFRVRVLFSGRVYYRPYGSEHTVG